MDVKWPLALFSCFALLNAGCAAKHCAACDGSQADLETTYQCDATGIVLPPEPVDMLFLSGGGAFGAYGAGVLVGWSKADNPPRRQFHLVTGVSTGALHATHAFLGKLYDEDLYKEYTQLEYPLMPPRPFWEWFYRSSINKTTGLKKIIREQVAPNPTIDLVAAERSKGRLLCAGTVNLESGQFVAWDLTKIAEAGKYDLYRDVVLASASVPVFSPNVQIDGDRHVDGGVRNQVFALDLIRAVRHKREDARQTAGRDRAYVVVNGQLSVKAECVQNRIVPIALRTVPLMMNEVLLSDVAAIEHTMSGGDRCDPETYYLSIKDDYPLNMTDADFDNQKMCRLFCRGRYDGEHGLWDPEPPFPKGPRPCGPTPYHPGDGLDDSSCPADMGSVICPKHYDDIGPEPAVSAATSCP